MSEISVAICGDTAEVMEDLFDRVPATRFALLQGVELCLQSISDVPEEVVADAPAQLSPFQIISGNYPYPDIEFYVPRLQAGKTMPAEIGRFSDDEFDIFREWHCTDFGWLVPVTVKAVTRRSKRGSCLEDVSLFVVDSGQKVTAFEGTQSSSHALLNPAAKQIARTLRQDFLDERLA